MLSIKHGKHKKLTLDAVLDGPDEFGLLKVEARRYSSAGAPLELSKFEEVNDFIDKNGSLPNPDGELSEKLLARRLQSYIDNIAAHDSLKAYDRHNLLLNTQAHEASNTASVAPATVLSTSKPLPTEPVAYEEVTSLDDIFNSASFANINTGEESIFDISNVPSVSERDTPDEIAQQRPCEDFYKFESIFKDLMSKLKTGKLNHVHFQKESQVQEGDAFITDGVLCLIDEVGEYREDNLGRYNPRLRIIFENGTESNHLLRSFGRRMYKDKNSRRIIRDADSVVDAFNNVTHHDKRAGQIYFVTTTSDNSVLRAIPNLIKIGYTEQTVEERTKNAKRDIAFLEAPVRILASLECYNLNPNKFESLIHGFLYAQRLQVTLTGKNRKEYQPREWFSVDLNTAMEVAKRIIDGSIVKYRMDNTTARIVKK